MTARKLPVPDRLAMAAMSLDGLVTYCRSLELIELGRNNRLILSEAARHLDVSTDAVSIALLRGKKYDDHQSPQSVWHWGVFSEDRLAQFKAMPGRKWNGTCKSNDFTIQGQSDPAFFASLGAMFAKTLVITDLSYRVETGTAKTEWIEPVIYKLLPEPVTINLQQVLDKFTRLRPQDIPQRLGLFGDTDAEFRTLFGPGLSIDTPALGGFNLQTRHPSLLFRIFVPDGQPRYMPYSVGTAKPQEILFGDSKSALEKIAVFKKTQQQLAHPIIENRQEVRELLWVYPSPPSRGTPESSQTPNGFTPRL
jgi:hypothetical protein